MTTAGARIAAWRESLDVNLLWPDTTAAQRVAGYEQILAAARNVLALRPARLDAAGEADAQALGVAAFLSGMGPLLGWWIERKTVAASPALTRILAEHLAHNRRRAATTTTRLRDVLAALGARDIVPAVLKGTYTARRYFDDPAVRPGSDADLLVAPREFDAARAALRGLGMECVTRHTRPEREEWASPGSTAVHSVDLAHEANPWLVDLHQSLDRTYFPGLTAGLGAPTAAELIRWDSPFGPARALAQPLLAAHLAIHAGSDFPDGQLVRIVELVMVVRQGCASGELRWDDLRALLHRTKTARFAFPGFEMAELMAPGTLDPGLRADLVQEATPRMRRLVAECVRNLPLHSPAKSVDIHLMWAKGPRQVARKLWDFVYPTGPEISARDRLGIWRRRFGFLVRGRVAWRARAPAP